MAMKKYNNKRKGRATVRKPRATSKPRDGQNLIVNAYFEARKELTATEGHMSYSINIDPKQGLVTKGASVLAYDGGADGGQPLQNDKLSYLMYNKMSDIFNQYRINGANIRVRVDGKCGLEHPVICSTDKGDGAPVTTMGSAVTGAHKAFSMSASKREIKYGCKNTGQDKDYLSTAANQNQDASAIKYLKVFQKLPKAEAAEAGAAAQVCEHQIQVTLSLTLKDTKNLN